MKENEDIEDIINLEGIIDIKELLAKEGVREFKTKEDFVSFIHELSKDYHDDSDRWENIDIESYLEALAAWVSSMEGYYKYFNLKIPEKSNWQLMADMLDAARFYGKRKIDIEGIKKIKEIKTKQEFVSFANELSESFYDDPESWKNNNIGTYLEALAAWINDMEGYYKNQGLPAPENLEWQLMADMLDAARFYE
jgi:hypothetical protein